MPDYTLSEAVQTTAAKAAAMEGLMPFVDRAVSGELIVGGTPATVEDFAELYGMLRKAVKEFDYEANRAGRVATKHMPDGEERCRTYLTKAKEHLDQLVAIGKETGAALASFGASDIVFVDNKGDD